MSHAHNPEPTGTPAGRAEVILTDAAVQKVMELLSREGRDDLHLRVAVQPGGCSGLRYQLFFDDRMIDGDFVTRYGDDELTVATTHAAGGGIDG